MELKDKYLLRGMQKNRTAKLNAAYFKKFADDNKKDKYKYNNLMNRSERIENCLTYWNWERYLKNKVLDLKNVSRCGDVFCPNCRAVNVGSAINKIYNSLGSLLNDGYDSYLVTLTIPSVSGEVLNKTLDKMNKGFVKFWQWLSYDFRRSDSFKNRMFQLVGCIKCIEITVQKDNYNMFHPHFHIIAFLNNHVELDNDLLIKYIPGGFNKRTGEGVLYSLADIFIQKLWFMAMNNINIKKFDGISNNWGDNYIADIRELDFPKGIFEVFKYVFKDSQIENYEVFKIFYESLKNRRIRQGYGKLFNNIDLDNFIDDSIYESIESYLMFNEVPEDICLNSVYELFNNYKDYKKVSRFSSMKYVESIVDY